jgi:hypothetical protein
VDYLLGRESTNLSEDEMLKLKAQFDSYVTELKANLHRLQNIFQTDTDEFTTKYFIQLSDKNRELAESYMKALIDSQVKSE